MSEEELWQMAEQLTELGRRLSDLKISVDVPAVPALGIKERPLRPAALPVLGTFSEVLLE